MSKPKTDISEIIEGVITYAPPKSKQATAVLLFDEL